MRKVFVFLILAGFCLAKTPGEAGLAFLKLERDPLGFFENPASLVDKGNSASFMYSMPLSEVDGLKQRLVNVFSPLKKYEQTINTGSGKFDYYLKNKDNKELAPGMYIWILDDGKDKKRGKFGVIR
ncbi:MAG: hypothetical protein AB1595_00845 [bacterium]